MKRILSLLLLFPAALFAQPAQRMATYDLKKDRLLYTVGYAHLDTQWNWDYATTIDLYLKRTLSENIDLIEKYPDYVFNFSGSRRYALMKEYYPDMYRRMKEKMAAGQWFAAGACVDEGEVNISSSESVIRQVLYGNLYYEHEFGRRAEDYLLPDCFGFAATLPSALAHAGVKGFSTQKLTWRAAVPIPFNVGVWEGPDGRGVIAALNATAYASRVPERLDLDSVWSARIDQSSKKYGLKFDYRYYGVGDRGGSPRLPDIKNAIGSLNHKDSKFRVLLTSSDQMFRDVTPAIRAKMPVYKGDLLLIEHSAGSLTSQSFLKLINRRNENLAAAAEAASVYADWCGAVPYPFASINGAWDLILGTQMHDILPGTSIPTAYEYSWNDSFLAANMLTQAATSGVEGMVRGMDTRASGGRTVAVYNPAAWGRTDIAQATLKGAAREVEVVDAQGIRLPSQIVARDAESFTVIFPARVEAMGVALFEVKETAGSAQDNTLKVSRQGIENGRYKVAIAADGDISSIYDKLLGRELLSAPASLEVLRESPAEWPAWNMDWKDRQKPPIGRIDQNVYIRVVETGPVRATVEVSRERFNSRVVQRISLAAGEAGRAVEVENLIDWQSKGVSLKAAFPLTASNPVASYSLDNAVVQRGNNEEKKFEVPSRRWFDLTDASGDFGVTILENGRYGSDKPDDNTLRLTLMYTPEANVNRFTYQATQDFGIHRVKYAILGHKGGWQGVSPVEGRFFNQPLMAFETSAHPGGGKSLQAVDLSLPSVDVMALKKAEQGDAYIIRLNETDGRKADNLTVGLMAPVIEAWEVDGQERRIGSAKVADGKLATSLTPFAIRSFAVRLGKPGGGSDGRVVSQATVELPYNMDVISTNADRKDGGIGQTGATLPAEQLPSRIVCGDVAFTLAGRSAGENNAVGCKGQTLVLPKTAVDGDRLAILAFSEKGAKGDFLTGGPESAGVQEPESLAAGLHTRTLEIAPFRGYLGQHYGQVIVSDRPIPTQNELKDSVLFTMLSIEQPYLRRDAVAWYATHYHTPAGNATYQYCYLYLYEIPLTAGATEVILPENPEITVMAAEMVAPAGQVTPAGFFYEGFEEYPVFHLRRTEAKPTQAHR